MAGRLGGCSSDQPLIQRQPFRQRDDIKPANIGRLDFDHGAGQPNPFSGMLSVTFAVQMNITSERSKAMFR